LRTSPFGRSDPEPDPFPPPPPPDFFFGAVFVGLTIPATARGWITGSTEGMGCTAAGLLAEEERTRRREAQLPGAARDRLLRAFPGTGISGLNIGLGGLLTGRGGSGW